MAGSTRAPDPDLALVSDSEAASASSRAGARERLLEFLRFAIVGGSSTALFMAVYTVAVLVGAPYPLAQFCAFLVSMLWGFVLHHRFTFRTGHSGSLTGEAGIWRWFGLQGAVQLMNLGGLAALIDGAGLSKLLAQAILLPFIPLITYGLSRRYVFAR